MTSRDILNIVLSVCALWISIFLCWLLYYAAQVTRQGYHVIKDFNKKLQRIDDAVQSIRQKFEHSSMYLGLVAEGVKELAKYLIEKKKNYSAKKKRKSSKDEL